VEQWLYQKLSIMLPQVRSHTTQKNIGRGKQEEAEEIFVE
jgi:hypothetical protein